MGLTYEAQKGFRVKSQGFYCVTTFDGYWWVHRLKRWVKSSEATGERSTDYVGVRSVKAFRRLLRQWKKYLPGVKFILVSRYLGHNVFGKT